MAIREAEEVFVSAASAWEVAIKSALGKVATSRSVSIAAQSSGFTELPVMFRHAEAVASLPSHHRDPFDRLLVAQAHAERLTLVTRDPVMAQYGVKVLRA